MNRTESDKNLDLGNDNDSSNQRTLRLIILHIVRDRDWKLRGVKKPRNVVPGILSRAILTQFRRMVCRKRLNSLPCSYWDEGTVDYDDKVCTKCKHPGISMPAFSDLLWGRHESSSNNGSLVQAENVMRHRLNGTRVLTFNEMRSALAAVFIHGYCSYLQMRKIWDELDEMEASGNIFLRAKKKNRLPLPNLNTFLCGFSLERMNQELRSSREKELLFAFGLSKEPLSKEERLRLESFSLDCLQEEIDRIDAINLKKGVDALRRPEMAPVKRLIDDI